jgi:hypothetical protein
MSLPMNGIDTVLTYLKGRCKPSPNILNMGTLGDSSYCEDFVF